MVARFARWIFIQVTATLLIFWKITIFLCKNKTFFFQIQAFPDKNEYFPQQVLYYKDTKMDIWFKFTLFIFYKWTTSPRNLEYQLSKFALWRHPPAYNLWRTKYKSSFPMSFIRLSCIQPILTIILNCLKEVSNPPGLKKLEF